MIDIIHFQTNITKKNSQKNALKCNLKIFKLQYLAVSFESSHQYLSKKHSWIDVASVEQKINFDMMAPNSLPEFGLNRKFVDYGFPLLKHCKP